MTTSEAPQEIIIGGRYRVIRELGRGGMGSVFEAENLRTHRRVAIKTMRPEVSERAEMARRFEREAQAGGRLRHPNVIDVLDMGDDDTYGFVYIVQEFLEGGDLGRCLKAVGALPPHAVVATLLPIMDALAAAHELGIVHRDIKPDNIFLHETPHGVVPKLIDFGIARFSPRGEDEGSRTAVGQMVGSPNYMSPEQARGDEDLDGRSDVWSLGVVFYKALSRSIAYAAPNTNALIAKIIYEEPTPLTSLAPHVPGDLAAVIQRAVTKDRAQRWPTMRAFADALRACALWQGVDGPRAQRWIVNVRAETLEPLPPVNPSWLPPPPPGLAAGNQSGVTSGQRSGPWQSEVPVNRSIAPPGRLPRQIAGVVAAVSTAILLTAGVLWTRRAPVSPAPEVPLRQAAARIAPARPPVAPTPPPVVARPAVVPAPPVVVAPAPVVAVAPTVVTAPTVVADAGVAVAAPVAPTAPEPPAAVEPRASHRSHSHSRHSSSDTAPARGVNGARILR